MEYNRPIIGRATNLDGEVTHQLRQGDRIISGNSLNSYRTKRIREAEALKSGDKQEWNLEHFFKGHIPEIRGLMKSLSIYDRGFLFSIATYVGYEDCCLKFDNGVCLDFEDLVDVSGMSRGKLSQVLSGLIKADIIYKGINSKGMQYFVNPWIYCKGVRINAVLKTMFKNYHVRVLGGRQWGKVGVDELDESSLIEKIHERLNSKEVQSNG
jgi:hypothetical protein